ncbi:GatB/YqeY domain-containing protein [Candidatus Saccharibacteria bacterium]|nr:GatB/YqeY domain-containing protein [Candidatus Saccharibacteria bacterium]
MKDKIQARLKEAMLAKDDFLKIVLSGLKSAILYEEVAKGKKEEGLSDEEVLAVIAREVKKRDDAIEIYASAGNKELEQKEMAEREVLAKFLPEKMSEEETIELIEATIISTGAESLKDIGRVIGAVKAEVGISADGALIAKLVKDKLSK